MGQPADDKHCVGYRRGSHCPGTTAVLSGTDCIGRTTQQRRVSDGIAPRSANARKSGGIPAGSIDVYGAGNAVASVRSTVQDRHSDHTPTERCGPHGSRTALPSLPIAPHWTYGHQRRAANPADCTDASGTAISSWLGHTDQRPTGQCRCWNIDTRHTASRATQPSATNCIRKVRVNRRTATDYLAVYAPGTALASASKCLDWCQTCECGPRCMADCHHPTGATWWPSGTLIVVNRAWP